MGVHKRKRWFQIQRPAHAKVWISELHGCGAAGTLGQVQQQGQAGRGRQPTYSMLAGASGMHSIDEGGGHGVGITPRGTRPNTGTHTEANASNAEKEIRMS